MHTIITPVISAVGEHQRVKDTIQPPGGSGILFISGGNDTSERGTAGLGDTLVYFRQTIEMGTLRIPKGMESTSFSVKTSSFKSLDICLVISCDMVWVGSDERVP